jgi:hypothetical protein
LILSWHHKNPFNREKSLKKPTPSARLHVGADCDWQQMSAELLLGKEMLSQQGTKFTKPPVGLFINVVEHHGIMRGKLERVGEGVEKVPHGIKAMPGGIKIAFADG